MRIEELGAIFTVVASVASAADPDAPVPPLIPVEAAGSGPLFPGALIQDAAARPAFTPHVEPSFTIAGADGVSTMRIYGYVQYRYTANLRDTDSEGNDLTQGFGFRETRLGARGTIGSKDWTYYLQAALDTGDARLSDVWLRRDLGDGWALRFGSFKPPFLYEELAPAMRQLLADRSVVDAYFQQGRAQAVELQYRQGAFEGFLALSDGWRRNNDWRYGDAWGLTGRVGWQFFGTRRQREDFQAWRGEEPMLAIGVAGHIQDGAAMQITSSERSNRFFNDTRITSWTADIHWEQNGLILFAAVMGEHDRPPEGGSRDALGLMVQAGYFITDDIQLVARAEWGTTDGDLGRPRPGDSLQDEFAAITLGAAWYLWGNNAKLVADVVIPLDEVGSVWGITSRGLLADEAGASGQAALRVLFQWGF